ncbi:MAG: hypothetical protein ACPG5B_06370 [Chitinophagales bacterium]
MLQSKLIGLLNTFSAKEWKLLHKFVHSPYHNEHQGVKKLFVYLQEKKDCFSKENVSKVVLFAIVFGKKAVYKDAKIRLVGSYLLKVVEEFLMQESLKVNVFSKQILLLKSYRERQLSKHFTALMRLLQQQQTKFSFQDAHYFLAQQQLSQELNQYIEQQQNRSLEPNLQQLSDSLDAFYLINKLKCCCAIMNYQNITAIDYELPFADAVLQHLAKNNYAHIPIIRLYYLALLTLKENDKEEYFAELKQTLFQNLTKISLHDLQDIFVLARNYCIKRINNGDAAYLSELFDLYKIEIKEQIILENGQIPPSTYKNIVTLGIHLQQFEWTEQFINDYKTHIASVFSEDVFHYNLARLFFDKKEYNKAIVQLNLVSFNEKFLALDTRVLLAQAYYELDETEVLYALLDSFYAYLKRKKNIAYHQAHYLNFVSLLKKMIRILPKEKIKKEQLFQLINRQKTVEKKWLLDKWQNLR